MFSRNRSTISCSGVKATTLGASRRVTYRLTSRSAKKVTKKADGEPRLSPDACPEDLGETDLPVPEDVHVEVREEREEDEPRHDHGDRDHGPAAPRIGDPDGRGHRVQPSSGRGFR